MPNSIIVILTEVFLKLPTKPASHVYELLNEPNIIL